MATIRNIQFLNPTQISGCALWLDAADASTVVTSGSAVTQWNDKSGNGNNATQVTAINRPSYTNNGIIFNASSSNFMNINVAFNTSHSVFLVARSASGTQNYYYSRIGATGAGPTIIQYYTGTSIEYFDVTDRATFVASPSSTSIFMINFVRNFGNTVTGFYYGSNAFSIPQTNSSNTSQAWAYIGRSDVTNYLNATIFEFIIFSSALSTIQRQQIEGSLAWKWGLQASLPTSHPYYNNPVVANFPLLAPITASFTTSNYFQPTAISGCALWLDAADSNSVVTSGTTVTAWNDKSGNGRNATPSNSPTYSSSNIDMRNISYFNGSMNIASGALQTTAFVVAVTPNTLIGLNCRILSVSDGIGVDYDSPTGFVPSGITSRNGYAYRSIGANSTAIIPTNTRFLCTTVAFSNGGFVFSYNGNYPSGASSNYASNTNTSNTNTLTKYYLGITNGGGNSYITGQAWNGLMNEVIMFNRTLSQSEYQQVEGYLAWKWGLQRNLPTSHPYYNNPILPNLNIPLQVNPTNNTFVNSLAQFSPLSITGTALWLDAADSSTLFQDSAGTVPVTNGSQIQLWRDKSGTNNNATNSQTVMLYNSNRFNNLPTIFFPGTQTTGFSLSGALLPNGSSDASYFFVINKNNSATQVYFTHGGATQLKQFYADAPLRIDRAGVSLISDGTSITNLNTIVSSTETSLSGGVNGWRNGTPFTTNGATNVWSVNTTAAWLGSGAINGTSFIYSGVISEVLVFNRALTTFQRQQVEGYLAWKWGLQANLPSSHPYILFPPN